MENVNENIEIIKRNQMGILKLKSTITEKKKFSWGVSTGDLSRHKKHSVNSNIGQQALESLRRKTEERKMSQPKRLMEYNQVNQHMHIRRREQGRKNIWRNNDQNLPKFVEYHECTHPRS